MDEGQNLTINQMELLKKLQAIGSDLWGGPASPAEDGAAEAKTAEEPVKQPKTIGIDSLWKTADETVDWTDALAHSVPTDGLTGRRLWSFYHSMAEKVLAGDPDAYTEVLRTANPLGELTEYAESINMRVPDAESLESTFVCKAELLEKNGKLYPAAMGLRIARDLLACLPVSEVRVQGEYQGEEIFSAVYPRQKLLHQNFAFIDPIAFAE